MHAERDQSDIEYDLHQESEAQSLELKKVLAHLIMWPEVGKLTHIGLSCHKFWKYLFDKQQAFKFEYKREITSAAIKLALVNNNKAMINLIVENCTVGVLETETMIEK